MNNGFKRWALAGLALMAMLGFAEAADVPSVSLRYQINAGTDKAVKLRFPLIRLPEAQASEAVNLLLHHLVLNTLPPAPGTPEALGQKEIALPQNEATVGQSSVDMGPLTLRHGGRVLTVVANLEGCGAYCEEYKRHFAFDVMRGRLLSYADLLTAQGRTAVNKMAVDAYRKTLRNFLAGLKRQARKGTKDKEIAETREMQELLYKDCLERYAQGGARAAADNDGAMSLLDNALVLTQGRCSNHAMRALDDIGDLSFRVDLATLKPHLTPYGRWLLFATPESDMGQVLAPSAQIYRGTLDTRLPVTLFIDLEGAADSASSRDFGEATYYYDRFRRPILLRGERTGPNLTLTESPVGAQDDAKGKGGAPEVLKLTVRPGRLSGQWSGAGKSLPFEVEAFPPRTVPSR